MSEHASSLPQPLPSTGVPTGRMGMWWFLASEVLIFGGLVTIYLLCRLHHPEWAEQASHTVVAAGAFNTLVLLTSSLSVVLAHEAAERGDAARAFKLMWVTILGGLLFLGVKVYEYSHEIHEGFTPVSDLFWSFYFVMTGLHAAHVIGGMAAMVIVSLGVRRGENLQRVEYVGMYWHLVDIVWIFLFPLLYLSN